MSRTDIVEVRWYALAVPLERVIADSQATLTHWTVPVVEVTTGDGLTGTGIGGIHTGAELVLAVVEQHYAPRLLGRDASLIKSLWWDLYNSPIVWSGRAGVTHLALGLIDIALWDLASQRAAMPLWKMLGGHHRVLDTYNTDGGWLSKPLPELVSSLSELVDRGWTSVKMKVGGPDWREDVRRLEAARAAVGPDVELSCDANKVWDLITATKVIPAIEDLSIAWLEEPIHPDDVAGHAKLQAMTNVPIACGESLYTRHAFRDFILADALRIAQLDVTRLAGITEYLEVAAFVETSGALVLPHAGDMMVVHQHLAASSLSASPRLEFIPWTLRAFEVPVQLNGTQVVLPEYPGASTRIAEAAKRDWSIHGIGGSLRA